MSHAFGRLAYVATLSVVALAATALLLALAAAPRWAASSPDLSPQPARSVGE